MAPPVNLALHLRLARILTGRSVASEARLGPEALECLAALDDLMVAMDERIELLRLPEAVEAAAEETVVLDSEETAATSVMNLAEVAAAVAEAEAAGAEAEVAVEVVVEEAAVAAPEAEVLPPDAELPDEGESAPTLAMESIIDARHAWGKLHDRLYEDVLWLFKMGDNEGALNSLARLMDLGDGTQELERFLSINQQKLYDLYHRLVGDPSALVERQEDAVIGDRYFFQQAEVEALLENVNGSRPISEVIEASELPDLKVYSYLHRVRREGLVRIHRSDA